MSLFSLLVAFLFNLTAAKYAVVSSLVITALLHFFIQPVKKYVHVLYAPETTAELARLRLQEAEDETEREKEEKNNNNKRHHQTPDATPARRSAASSQLYNTPFSPSSPSGRRSSTGGRHSKSKSLEGQQQQQPRSPAREADEGEEEAQGSILSPNRTLDHNFNTMLDASDTPHEGDAAAAAAAAAPAGGGRWLGLFSFLFLGSRGHPSGHAGHQVPLMVVGRQVRARQGEVPSQLVPDILLSCVAGPQSTTHKNKRTSLHEKTAEEEAEAADAQQLTDAIRSGEVFFSDAPSRVLTLNERIQHLVDTIRRRQAYEQQTKEYTRQELHKLYATPAFQQWYADNRDDLLREVDLRQRGILFRRVTCLAVLLVGVFALPCLSFDPHLETRLSLPLFSAPSPKDVTPRKLSAMTMSQLLALRRATLKAAHPLFFTTLQQQQPQSGVPLFRIYQGLVAQVEILSSYIFTLALCVTPLMPCRSVLTALFTVVPFCGILYELWELTRLPPGEAAAAAGNPITFMGGMGTLVVFSIVVINVIKAVLKEARVD